MILFGSRVAHVKSVNAEGLHCEHCNEKNTLVFHIFRKHAHIFWIPMFPYKKTGISQCTHCKNQLEPNEMPERIKRKFLEVKKEAKGPIWQFVGLLLLVILIIAVAISVNYNNKENKAYIEDPKAGDIYEFKVKSGEYTSLKVVEVTDDSVYVIPNVYMTDKRRGVDDIDKEENYNNEEQYGISREDLKNLFEDGEIFDVNR